MSSLTQRQVGFWKSSESMVDHKGVQHASFFKKKIFVAAISFHMIVAFCMMQTVS
jgi:hypothetical protein